MESRVGKPAAGETLSCLPAGDAMSVSLSAGSTWGELRVSCVRGRLALGQTSELTVKGSLGLKSPPCSLAPWPCFGPDRRCSGVEAPWVACRRNALLGPATGLTSGAGSRMTRSGRAAVRPSSGTRKAVRRGSAPALPPGSAPARITWCRLPASFDGACESREARMSEAAGMCAERPGKAGALCSRSWRGSGRVATPLAGADSLSNAKAWARESPYITDTRGAVGASVPCRCIRARAWACLATVRGILSRAAGSGPGSGPVRPIQAPSGTWATRSIQSCRASKPDASGLSDRSLLRSPPPTGVVCGASEGAASSASRQCCRRSRSRLTRRRVAPSASKISATLQPFEDEGHGFDREFARHGVEWRSLPL